MAALAVKASPAISSVNTNSDTTSSKSQISPLMASILSASEEDMDVNMYMNTKNKKSSGVAMGISRSGSMWKLQRYSTHRAKLVTRSFKRLTTIHEGSDLQAY